MEKFLNALERKFGRYAVPDLIKYVVIIYCAGAGDRTGESIFLLPISVIEHECSLSWTDLEIIYLFAGTVRFFIR